jgi:hypothetical protein
MEILNLILNYIVNTLFLIYFRQAEF